MNIFIKEFENLCNCMYLNIVFMLSDHIFVKKQNKLLLISLNILENIPFE